MAIKRPLCNYAGDIKELAIADTMPDVTGTVSLPFWKIDPGETVYVGERQEYAVNSGFFDNAGEIVLADQSILFVAGVIDVYTAWKILATEVKTVGKRQEYLLHNGVFDIRGEFILSEDSILYVGA
jgi:hypothetical protein